ncbi:hypothetical protein PPL_07504 [Heterostelium album PN500]|uniref:Uncharacterized protein n=1 Tax=Heterostelium pallidum (strain ATCC 26659 / Pp 5 / PN500) TaxID=670386 RepID=D3BG53_HETP5|nr:hypothetical protein PPL_07504 [Heterostelium album PN500]EFA79645.1 hypothetical protein PPL_07504 [Heterostelium album PN500]|eukprot:XP_020431766.1 hypothetical protein PPL_07504 [Heterostelium album PN500]
MNHLYLGSSSTFSSMVKVGDFIYIFGANSISNNINDSTFERYSTIDINASYHLFTFFFKGHIYTLTPATIFQFNINNKTTVELSVKITGKPMAACTDGNGNLYIQSYSELQRINIETNEIKSFEKSTIAMNGYYNLIYHQSNDGQSYIYSIRGKNQNYVFSFDNNKWEQILQDDPSDRTNCANILDQK